MINTRLKARLKEEGLTHQQLADQVGISVRTVSRLINGHHTPTEDTASMIAIILKCRIQDIFKEVYK